MNKRGLSNIVVAIILVLIAIMAVTILWTALRGLFEADYDTGLLTLNLKIKSASVDESNIVDVLVRRNVGKGSLVKIKFIFENSTGSYSEIRDINLKELEQKKFSFNLAGNITNIIKVSIAPVIKTERGKEIIGSIVDVYIISIEPYGYIIPSPRLEIVSLTPDMSVNRNEFFEFKVNVSCLEADCGSIDISLDPSPTTISLNSGNDSADVWIEDNLPYETLTQMKWSIIDIPASSTINDGLLCLYINRIFGTPDNDLRVWYINNQTWLESTGGAVQLRDLTVLNETNVTLSSTTNSTWSCFNVTTQLRQSYANGNQNFTVRFMDPDYDLEYLSLVTDDEFLYIGQTDTAAIRFEDRENSGGSGNTPYFNITYTSTSTGKGLILTTTGATPFYTINSNPKNINLNKDQSIVVEWNVNATGNLGTYNFFSYANKTADMSMNAKTETVKITIV